MPETTLHLVEPGQQNPCIGCPAPCCRMQLIPYKTPVSAADIDHVRYLLLFPGTEMAVAATGEWFVLKWQDCRELDSDTCVCRVHHTLAQPRICYVYSAQNCWYKRNFVAAEIPPDLYRLDLARFKIWVETLLFDQQGALVQAPCFEDAQAILRDLPIAPMFEPLSIEALERDLLLRAGAPAPADTPQELAEASSGALS